MLATGSRLPTATYGLPPFPAWFAMLFEPISVISALDWYLLGHPLYAPTVAISVSSYADGGDDPAPP